MKKGLTISSNCQLELHDFQLKSSRGPGECRPGCLHEWDWDPDCSVTVLSYERAKSTKKISMLIKDSDMAPVKSCLLHPSLRSPLPSSPHGTNNQFIVFRPPSFDGFHPQVHTGRASSTSSIACRWLTEDGQTSVMCPCGIRSPITSPCGTIAGYILLFSLLTNYL